MKPLDGGVGVCIGDELLEPPSCAQPPGHRMEGLRAALSDERRLQKDRGPEGSDERNRSNLSDCGSQCVCGYRVFTVQSLSALVGTPIASRSPRQKARGLFLVCF